MKRSSLTVDHEESPVNVCQTDHWLDPLFTTDAMRAVFSDNGRLQGILDFEAALATALARCGIIPQSAAEIIAGQCRAELFDLAALARGSALAGNTAIPVVKDLTARVAAAGSEAERYVHWGATSQDAMDTGLVLQCRAAVGLIETALARLSGELGRLARAHQLTPMAGRTWLQQASPTTFGLKAAGWMSAIERDRARLQSVRPRLLVLQLGGAVGTLASLGERGLDVAAVVAEELSMGVPDVPWHAQRDRLAELATSFGLVVGSLGKIARDIALMSQTEVAEVFEPRALGHGGSSTMPQKRNPVGCAVVLAAAARVPALVSVMLAAMVQEHERGLGGWQTEWGTLPEICLLTAGAIEQTLRVASGLEVDAARMRANLEATRGLIFAEAVSMALAVKVGRQAAHQVVEEACQNAIEQKRPLSDVLADDARVSAHLPRTELAKLFEPTAYLGLAGRFVDRALAREGQ
jgi:3-carboxy-cis,cis-muconate cycloisomerase